MKRNTIYKRDCLEFMATIADNTFDCVIGSPPYPRKGARYPNGQKMSNDDWLKFMVSVVRESVRVSKGWVWFVVNNTIHRGYYEPMVEGLIWKCYELGVACDRPDIWHKNMTPNRQGKYFSNDHEHVICFKSEKYPAFDWERVAVAPKYTSGGKFRQRKNTGGGDRGDGGDYPTGKLAQPRDVFRCTVGGGHMGFDRVDDELATSGKAPYPLGVPTRFLKVGVPTGGLVYDPFCGAGTTCVAAHMLQMNYVATEISDEEIAIARKRLRRAKRHVQRAL